MKKIAVLAAMLAATTLCAPAMAYESGGFVRVEGGNTTFDVDTGAGSADSDDTSFGLRGGYYFNPFFGVEGFYTRYGQDDGDGIETTIDGYGLGLFAKYNFGADYDGFYISGRAGAARISADLDAGEFGSADASETTPYLGVGVGYDFAPNMGVGLNYDVAQPTFETAGVEFDVDVKTLSLDFEYRF